MSIGPVELSVTTCESKNRIPSKIKISKWVVGRPKFDPVVGRLSERVVGLKEKDSSFLVNI